MFQKMVAIEPISMLPEGKEKLKDYAKKVVLYQDMPDSDEEIVRRMGDADAMLVSYTTSVSGAVIEKCPNLTYIGMCCSLYSEESASVDIKTAREHGIVVTGIRDYGDAGVGEFVVSELVQLLHGYGPRQWDKDPREITGTKVGIIGLGTTGQLNGRCLKFFGADIYYNSRTRKPEREAEGFQYLELEELLETCEIIITCLTKHTVVLHKEQFEKMGNHKILINTGLSPSFDMDVFKEWIENDENYFMCDSDMALDNKVLESHRNVRCAAQSSGMTRQAYKRLNDKVLENMERFLGGEY